MLTRSRMQELRSALSAVWLAEGTFDSNAAARLYAEIEGELSKTRVVKLRAGGRAKRIWTPEELSARREKLLAYARAYHVRKRGERDVRV